MVSDFTRCRHDGSLPVAWEVPEDAIVKDERGKEPNFVMSGGLMVHQFHRVAIPIPTGNPAAIQAAHSQLKNLLDTVLVIEGEFEHVSET